MKTSDDDTMRHMMAIRLDERAETLASETGWSFLQARRFLKDQQFVERRSGKERRAMVRDGEDRRHDW